MRQNRLDFRDLMAGGGSARARMAGGIAAIAGDGVASGEENAHCGPGVFHDLVVLAAVPSGSVHAFTRERAERRNHAGGNPTGEWSRLAARRATAGDPALALTEVATAQLRELRRSGSLPKDSAFAKLLNAALPDGKATVHLESLRFMGKVLRLLSAYYGVPKPDIRMHGAKVRKIIDEHVAVSDIARLIDDVPVQHGQFLEMIMERFPSSSTRAALLIHRIRAIISDIGLTDPEHARSLRERLERIIRDERARRIEALDAVTELTSLYKKCVDFDSEIKDLFGEYQATPLEFSICRALDPLADRQRQASLSRGIFRDIMPKTQIIDWAEKDSVRKEMERAIYERLKRERPDDAAIDGLTETIIGRVRAHHADPGRAIA